MMKKQIRAAADYWHANTVRFQILQDRLVGRKDAGSTAGTWRPSGR